MVNNIHINTGYLLAQFFSKFANFDSGSIVLGGFIILIALHYDVSLQELEQAQGKNRVDLSTCLTIKMITQMGDGYQLLLPDPQLPNPLPNLIRTTIQNRANWWMTAPQKGDNHASPMDIPPSAPFHKAGLSHSFQP